MKASIALLLVLALGGASACASASDTEVVEAAALPKIRYFMIADA